MGFQTGLSGLNAASKNLDAIGHNVANSATVGFKSSQSQFSDVFAASLSGGGSSQVGIGTKLSNVSQQFTQGNITASNNPLDMAINGNGFFQLSNQGALSYTRNGQFQLDKDGFIVAGSNSSLRLQGVDASGSNGDLKIDRTDQPASATTKLLIAANLDAGAITPSAPAWDTTPTATQVPDPDSYNATTAFSVFDSLGNAHTVNAYFVKSAALTWNVYYSIDGRWDMGAGGGATADAILKFTSGGAFDSTNSTISPVTFTTSALPVASPSGAANITIANTNFDYTGMTQFSGKFGVSTLSQDGYTAGRLAGFNVGSDGVLQGRYTNGQTLTLGEVVLANFANPQGLQQMGENQWAESPNSGPALVGSPGTSSLGLLQSSSTEDSNVDLTAELVNMIVAQRAYQANAQTIKTQDAIQQTLMNLR